MSGLSDFTAKAVLNYVCGNRPMPVLPGGAFPTYTAADYTSAGVWLALLTAVDTDAGTGGTEVSGGAYARVQVAGFIDASASFTTASTTLTVATIPAWVSSAMGNGAGMNVFDAKTGTQVGTISTWVTTTITLTGTSAINSSGSTDRLVISAFSPASGSAPSTITNAAVITFPAATANWGTVIAFELRDALTSGNLLMWDYVGNFSWLPATVSSASPGIITAKAHGYSASDPLIFSTEYGGTAPSFSQSNFTGVLLAVSPATDSFSVTNAATAVNTSSTGSGMVRKIVQQSIPNGVTASFAASALTATAA